MVSEQNGRGLATSPSSLQKRKNAWKRFVVLTVNPLDDAVVISEIKARNASEAHEMLEAGSHNLDHDIVFSEAGFENLVRAIKAVTNLPGK